MQRSSRRREPRYRRVCRNPSKRLSPRSNRPQTRARSLLCPPEQHRIRSSTNGAGGAFLGVIAPGHELQWGARPPGRALSRDCRTAALSPETLSAVLHHDCGDAQANCNEFQFFAELQPSEGSDASTGHPFTSWLRLVARDCPTRRPRRHVPWPCL